MKTIRKHFLFLCVLLIGLVAWRLWSTSHSEAAMQSAKRSTTASVAKNSNDALSKAVQAALHTPAQIRAGQTVNAMLYRNPDATIPLAQLIAAGVSKEDLTKGILDAQNAQPIDAYGKVVDQNGQPIAGVKAQGVILLNDGFEDSKDEIHNTVTDVQGLFTFSNLHGVSFGIGLDKAGYEFNPKLYLDWWAKYKPDPNYPMVFVMWKLQGAEPTISDDKFWGIIPDGRIYTIDFIKSKKIENPVAEGDLHVSITRPASTVRGQKYDWSFTMEAVDGGIVESHDAYPYQAPEQGYLDKIEITLSATDPKWQPEVQGRVFYLKSRAGHVYGHCQIDVISVYQNAAVFAIKSLVNPAASRNLEEDEQKTIKADSPAAQLPTSSTK